MTYVADLSSYLASFIWNAGRVLIQLALIIPAMVVITGVAYVVVTIAAVLFSILLAFQCLKLLVKPLKQPIFRTKYGEFS